MHIDLPGPSPSLVSSQDIHDVSSDDDEVEVQRGGWPRSSPEVCDLVTPPRPAPSKDNIVANTSLTVGNNYNVKGKRARKETVLVTDCATSKGAEHIVTMCILRSAGSCDLNLAGLVCRALMRPCINHVYDKVIGNTVMCNAQVHFSLVRYTAIAMREW